MTDERTPEALVAGLVQLLDVEMLDIDLFRGPRQPGGEGRVFGGQVIAQALQAAQRSVAAEQVAHSLHAYFMRPGDENLPILYRVERDFDGRSFANRRVVAMQRGQPILNLTASFQRPEPGYAHQIPMPEGVPEPEALPSERELIAMMPDSALPALRRLIARGRPIEIRPASRHSWLATEPGEPVQHSWFRVVAPPGDDLALHRAMLAYASDMTLLGTSLLPHGASWARGQVQTASLDHAIWFHEPFRADQWLLYTTDSPWSGHSRGFNRGRIYTREGQLVASVAQEGLIRPRTPRQD